jgi:phage terminase large subunit-like protein
LVPDLPLDLVAGNRAVAVFDRLRLADVTGTPTLGEAGGDWFRDIVRALFGSVDPVTKIRTIRELFLLVPKKNSKTTNGALLMLTALLLNERPRAPFLLTAPVQKTADEAFSAIAGAIALDPVLEAKLHVRDHLKIIVHRETKAKLEVMTFDPAIITGRKVVGALIDELHVLGKMPRAAKAMVQLRGGMQPFPEAFLATITTQSDEPPVGVFKDDLERARAVRDGRRQSPVLSVLYEFPMAMQQDPDRPWKDPANWPMVTPNAGRSVSIERLVSEYADEEAKGEEAFRIWASQHLNIEIGLALGAGGWAGAEFWERCGNKALTLDALLERSEVVVVGIDGGGLDDLLGLAVIGRDRETRKWLHWAHAWAHKIVLQRRKDIAEKLTDLEKVGDLTMVESPGEDVAAVADVVCRIKAASLLPEKNAIGVDAAGIGDIVDELTSPERGIALEQIVAISQGWKLNAAIKTMERKVAGAEVEHCDSPLMAWAVGNAKVEARGNAITITKQAAGSAKIDPLMATFDAGSLMALNPEAGGKKIKQGFVAL